jgi:hypothetical protein
MESNMPAKPDESKRLIKFFEFQTDAPLLGEPRNYGHVCRVAFGDRRQRLARNASKRWRTIRLHAPRDRVSSRDRTRLVVIYQIK